MINVNDPAILRDINENVLPPKGTVLYKFRATRKSRLESIIRKHTLWFGSPLTWNDPFDGQIRAIVTPTDEEFATWLKYSAPDMPAERIAYLVHHNKENPDKWPAIRDQVLHDVMMVTGMCCFSRTWDSILQWSYYANGHDGVALGFHRDLDLDLFGNAHRVAYHKEYPVINYFTESYRVIDAVLRVKSDAWRHEDEIRIWNNPPGLKNYKPEALREIIFGARCAAKDAQVIQKWCRQSGLSHVEFYQATTAPDSFAIKRNRI